MTVLDGHIVTVRMDLQGNIVNMVRQCFMGIISEKPVVERKIRDRGIMYVVTQLFVVEHCMKAQKLKGRCYSK